MRILIFCLLLAPSGWLIAQSGCTDWQALNFDAGVVENDGSCIYPATNYSLNFVQNLPDSLNETSGLLWYENKLWTHNDGGNPSKIYRWEPGSSVEFSQDLDASNSDWEDFTHDDTHFYLLDLGNNSTGSRQDLSVYQFALADLGLGEEAIPTQNFPVAYADQTDFESNSVDSTHYDCEAGIVLNGKLHLFTKDWIDRDSDCYVLDLANPESSLTSAENFDVDGLITAADIADDGTIALLGYTPVEVFVWLLWDYPTYDVFGGNKRRIELGFSPTVGQAEGLTFSNGLSGYISSERISFGGFVVEPKLWSFDFSLYLNVEEEQSPASKFTAFQKGNNIFWIHGTTDQVELYDQQGKLLQTADPKSRFDMKGAATGIYFVVFRKEGQVIGTRKVRFHGF